MFTLESNVEICYFFWSVIDVLKTLVKGISKAMQHRGIWKHVFALYGFPARNLGPNEKKLMDIIGFQCKNYGVQRFMAILCAITKLISYNFLLSFIFSSFQTFSKSKAYKRTRVPICWWIFLVCFGCLVGFVGRSFVWLVDLLLGLLIFCFVGWSLVWLVWSVDLLLHWFAQIKHWVCRIFCGWVEGKLNFGFENK